MGASPKRKNPEFGRHDECSAFTELLRGMSAAAGGAGKRRLLRKGAQLALPSGPFERVFWLARGTVVLESMDSAGRQVLLREFQAGELIGEFCFCEEGLEPHPEVAAKALADCEIVEIEARAFMRKLGESQAALSEFLGTVCRQLAHAERRIAILARRSAEERLALLLLELAEMRGVRAAKPGGHMNLAISHEEIAAAAAMSRPHVSVTLGRLRRLGLIQYRRGTPIEIDMRALRSHAEQAANAGGNAPRAARRERR